ncbi:MAG: TIR domain-containing protein [Candidatus Binatia bacterium]
MTQRSAIGYSRSHPLFLLGFDAAKGNLLSNMGDIFISYASADRERARMLADALARQGWSVWWDRTIPPGKEFDQVIEEALDAAKCVVVLWSKTSTASSWVKTEAAEAMRRKILVPALIDDVKIPLEFRRLQAADLSQWQGEDSHPELEKFRRSIEGNISGVDDPSPDPKPAPEPPPTRPRPEPKPFVHPDPRPSSGKWIVPSVVAIVAIVVILGGYLLYREHGRRLELERTIAREKQEQAERIAKEEAAREADLRKTEDNRRATERAAQLKAAQDQERAARAKSVQQKAEADRIAAERQKLAYAPKSMNLEWNDNALRYSGTLSWTSADATLRFTVFDGRNGARVGNYTLPAQVPGRSNYVVSGSISVPGDSVSPYPHDHSINLYFNWADGSLRLVQNCPRPGECYPGR